MAPRKAAAKSSSTDPKCPTIKLSIEKGPLSGQINEFHPGSLIRIGRVVRGNTLSIKDDGISSKHLIIQLDDSQQHWTITDLDSSNGTFLNSKPITPHQPILLSNGDEIKIGEMTVIRVVIAAGESRGRGRNLGVIPDDKELGLGVKVDLEKGNVRRSQRCNKAAVVDDEVVTEIENDLNVVEQKVSTRRTRNANKSNMEVSGSNVEVSENVSIRSSVKEKELVELGVVEVRSKKKGGRGKTNVQVEKTVAEEKDEEINVGHDSENLTDGAQTAGTSGVKKGDTGTRKGQLWVDLETMTLGEWFDFLEDYLPKQIIDATEEVISDMKQKAKRLHEYKLQQAKK